MFNYLFAVRVDFDSRSLHLAMTGTGKSNICTDFSENCLPDFVHGIVDICHIMSEKTSGPEMRRPGQRSARIGDRSKKLCSVVTVIKIPNRSVCRTIQAETSAQKIPSVTARENFRRAPMPVRKRPQARNLPEIKNFRRARK